MSDAADMFGFLADHMRNPETQWSMGTFGALAEFTRDADEPATLARSEGSAAAVTARGGIRLAPGADLRPVASETTTKHSWSHRVALCLAVDRCAMGRRSALTELGPDAAALREEDRGALLFDLGLDALQVDVCIRTAHRDLIARLRSQAGRSVFEPGNPAMGAIVAASPHRVFVSRLGRVEVFQPIPPAGGTSPDGPHTHVLPKLLHHRRTHAATEPVPDGFVPCAHLYPAHPAKDGLGRQRPFDPRRHEAFQQILRAFGAEDSIALKGRVAAAVAAGEDPSAFALPNDRFARTDVRVKLRQLKAANSGAAVLPIWIAAFERADQNEPEENFSDPYEHAAEGEPATAT